MDRSSPSRLPVWLGLSAVGGLTVLPLIWAFGSSLTPLEDVYRFPPQWDLGNLQWSNYSKAATTLPLFRFILNSCLIATACSIGAVLSSSMAGFAFARLPWRGRRLWFGLLIVALIVPSQVLLIPHFLIFRWLGWVGTYKPLIVPAWLGGGAFNVLLFRQVFLSIPRECLDAAVLDGATAWQVYWRVMLPMARPAILTAGVLSFVIAWQDFLDPLIYLSDFRAFPVSLGLRMYQSMAGTWANLLMAASLLSLVPVALLVLLLNRRVMSIPRPGE